MKNYLILKLLIVLLSPLLFTACKEDEEERQTQPVDTDTQSAEDYSLTDAEANKTMDYVARVFEELRAGKTSEERSVLPECAYTELDSTNGTYGMLIDFGTEGCLCSEWDGRVRRGKLFVNFNGRYRETGSRYLVTSENYYVGQNEHRIFHSVRNIGPNSSNQPVFEVDIADTVFVGSGATRLEARRQRTWIQGSDTQGDPWDDIYEVADRTQSGASGVNRRGESFGVKITTPLRVEIGCKEKVVSGVLEITPAKGDKRVVNYGPGYCDGLVTVIIRNRAITVSIG